MAGGARPGTSSFVDSPGDSNMWPEPMTWSWQHQKHLSNAADSRASLRPYLPLAGLLSPSSRCLRLLSRDPEGRRKGPWLSALLQRVLGAWRTELNGLLYHKRKLTF